MEVQILDDEVLQGIVEANEKMTEDGYTPN
jgi:hypothetical protein